MRVTWWDAVNKILKVFGKQLVSTFFVEDMKINLVRLIVLELICERFGVMTDEKGRKWLFDPKHHKWIEVTMPEKLRGKMVKIG